MSPRASGTKSSSRAGADRLSARAGRRLTVGRERRNWSFGGSAVYWAEFDGHADGGQAAGAKGDAVHGGEIPLHLGRLGVLPHQRPQHSLLAGLHAVVERLQLILRPLEVAGGRDLV